MSINHFSSDIPQTPWWTQQQHQHQHHHTLLMENPSPNSPNSNPQSLNYNPNCSPSPFYQPLNFTKIDESQIQKQPMFEKPLTPSDVGKLNRLVIPKQYAEKYFPLGAVAVAGNDSGEKGLLLSFEDESGKPWRFRYSYWSSSQSYVLTKGWSRFVKEKRLDAGDIVLFERHPADCERLFIGWRRRAARPAQDFAVAQPDGDCRGVGWGGVLYNAQPYPTHPHGPPLAYQAECIHAAGSVVGSQLRNNNGNGNSNKRLLRLFGVNMECQPEESESEPIASDGSSFSSDGPPHYHYYSTNHHQSHGY